MKKNYWLIIVIIFLAFLPCLTNGFVNWDDPSFLLEIKELRVLTLSNIQSYFMSTVQRIYVPLTLLTFAIEHHFFGYNPFVFHLNNLLLHICVALLVFYLGVLLGLKQRAALLGALIFGIHPMHVESVSWITERKDVLYSVFYMAAVIYYWRYLQSISVLRNEKRNTFGFFVEKYYWLAVIFGILSILSKPMALSLPLVFFLSDWFKGRRFERALFLDKIIHFLYILPITYITYSFHARIPGDNVWTALNIWIWTLTFYVKKFFFPAIFVPLYQLPPGSEGLGLEYILSWTILFFMVTVLFCFRKNKWVLFSFLFFFASVFFLLRFDGHADKSIVADRFMYLPSMGFCLVVGMGFDRFFKYLCSKRNAVKNAGIALIFLLFGFLFIKTFTQNMIWKNSETLWNYVLAFYPDSVVARNNLGNYYLEQGDLDKAMNEFLLTVYFKPDEKLAYYNMAEIFYRKGEFDQARYLYSKCLSVDPEYAPAYNNRGNMYLLSGFPEEALEDYSRAIALDPDHIDALNNRAAAYIVLGEKDRALRDVKNILTLDPENKIAIMRKIELMN